VLPGFLERIAGLTDGELLALIAAAGRDDRPGSPPLIGRSRTAALPVVAEQHHIGFEGAQQLSRPPVGVLVPGALEP
jgi:hypothetical protein